MQLGSTLYNGIQLPYPFNGTVGYLAFEHPVDLGIAVPKEIPRYHFQFKILKGNRDIIRNSFSRICQI